MNDFPLKNLSEQIVSLEKSIFRLKQLLEKKKKIQLDIEKIKSAKAYQVWQLLSNKPTRSTAKLIVPRAQSLHQKEAAWYRKTSLTQLNGLDEQPPMEGPLISIIMPVYNTTISYLHESISSILKQTYTKLQLILVDDASPNREVRRVLREYASRDPRVKVIYRPKTGGISAATNSGLEAVMGEFVGFFDHDDLLEPTALADIAAAIQKNPTAEFLYTDRDLFEGTLEYRFHPFFKPDSIAIETMLCGNVITHFNVLKKTLIEKTGVFDTMADGAQDWDYYLRALSLAEHVVHIPKVLYHWRVHPQSTASGISAKPYARKSQLYAVNRYLKTKQYSIRAVEERGDLKLIFPFKSEPSVTVHINAEEDVYYGTLQIMTFIKTAEYKNYRIVLHGETAPFIARLVEHNSLTSSQSSRVRIYNYGFLRDDTADYSLIISDHITPLSKGWISALIGMHQFNPSPAATTGKIVDEDDRIRATSYICADKKLIPLFSGFPRKFFGMYGSTEWLWRGALLNPEVLCISRKNRGAFSAITSKKQYVDYFLNHVDAPPGESCLYYGQVEFLSCAEKHENLTQTTSSCPLMKRYLKNRRIAQLHSLYESMQNDSRTG